MKPLIFFALFYLSLVFSCTAPVSNRDHLFSSGEAIHLKSPDGRYLIELGSNGNGQFQYSVAYDGQPVILPSSLGLKVEGQEIPGGNLKIVSVQDTSVDHTWKPVYGERNEYRDHYIQKIIALEGNNYAMDLVFRAYDEGIAFQYRIKSFKGRDTLVIRGERSEFVVPEGSEAWVAYSAQGEYKKLPVGEITKPCERPLVIQLKNGKYLAVGEAALVDYARMRLEPAKDRGDSLVSSLASEVKLPLPASTPWRFVMAGKSAGELLEHNFLLLNLNAPNALKDVSWIKPGKVIREVSLSTQGGKACIDFAAAHNLQYVEYDAGWYGPEYEEASDATTITLDPKRSKGPLDVHEVIRYGKEKGIGIIVYVNRRALEKQLDAILPLYESWGIKGVKYGFVRVGPQRWTSWLHEAIRKAADHHLMVDVHDEYRPTGYSRTYPNFMTCEGVRGDEESPSNTHTLITMFTRLIAGPADNTICYFTPRVTEKMGSHASQLAKAVCIYSPWQFLYWYDRPEGSPGSEKLRAEGGKALITDEPELEFFDAVPTVWDDTRVMEAEPGKYGTIARRSGEQWFIGSINGTEPHTVKIPLDFLEDGKPYSARIYRDDPALDTRTHVKIEVKKVDKQSVLVFDLKPGTGVALIISMTK